MPHVQFRWRRRAVLTACAAAGSLALVAPATGSAFASTGITSSLSATKAHARQHVALTIGSKQNKTDPKGSFKVSYSAEAVHFLRANAGKCDASGKTVTCSEFMNTGWKYDVLHFRVTHRAVPGSSFAFHITATSNGSSTNDAVTLHIAAHSRRVTAPAPTVRRATCRHSGRLIIPDVKGVDYTIHGHSVNGDTIHRPGRYHVHASADPGYRLRGHRNWHLRVDHRSRHCVVSLHARAVRHHHRNVVWEVYRTHHSSQHGTRFWVHVNRHNGWHGGTYYGRHVLRHGQHRTFFSTHHGGRLRVAYHSSRGHLRFTYATSYGHSHRR